MACVPDKIGDADAPPSLVHPHVYDAEGPSTRVCEDEEERHQALVMTEHAHSLAVELVLSMVCTPRWCVI